MTLTILAAYAPGLGHANTVLPLVEDFTRHGDCAVFLCGSQTVARQADTHLLPVHHRRAGPESFLRTSDNGLSGDEVITRMGRASRHDITTLIHELRPDLLVCDTSERGAVLAALDCAVPFVRVVSCADAATGPGSVEEARRRALIRGREHDDLESPLNLGTIAFGPPWYFHDTHPGEPLSCYRYRPPPTPAPVSGPVRPRALVSFGTFVAEPSPPIFEQIIEGLIDAGLRSVTLKIRHRPARDQIQRYAATAAARTGCEITTAAELNLRQHLGSADMLLCHGSATSTLEALYHQVIPIIAPTHGDTYFVARQCAATSTAVVIDWANGCTRNAIRQAAMTAIQGPAVRAGVERFDIDNNRLPPGSELVEKLYGQLTAQPG
ncbi:glycosyltransferase [Nocardia noduli]|uniref:glycosyltransferase n=1 Tax=Nocardia noduli TaxID=2815722 RepID=UPI001C22576F|nr:hypothetical protein [Nocardia noduli]